MRNLLSLLMLVLCARFSGSPLLAQQGGVLKPADMVMIELKGPAEHSNEISANYVLSDKGTLRLPKLCEEVEAKGITPTALARKIEELYKKEGVFKKPVVHVYLPVGAAPAVNAVTIAGEVQHPGEFPLRKNMRLLATISRAGGTTEWANPSAVKLIRDGKTTLYDLREIKENGSNNPVLQDGDNVIVSTK